MSPYSTLLVVLLIICSENFDGIVHGQKDAAPSRSVFTEGDFIIGGLSPVHFSPTAAEEEADPDSFMCRGGFNTRGFEAVEAMLFAMDMVNNGHLAEQVLPNITVGMDVKDTCTSTDYAVRESLNFTFIRNANAKDECSGVQRRKDQRTIAVVGAAYSGVSMAVTNLCGLFYVPLVSYASTSRLLSNKVQFRYFLRTVPSDMLQARVMADLVRELNWNFVIALSSDTEYGRSGIEAFKLALAEYKGVHDVCIPVDEKFTKRSPSSKFERIFRLMKANTKARVVILFAELHDAKFFIDKFARRRDLAKDKYVWIGSDAWADSKQVLKGNEHVLQGMLGVVPEVKHVREFDEYFVDFTEQRRKRNPWMRDYEQLKVAHNPGFHRQVFRHYSKAQYVMEAVLAVAYALHDILGCVPYKDCSGKVKTFSQKDQKDFLTYLQNVRFHGITRNTFAFDQLGDAIGIYDIDQLTLVGDNYEYVTIGKWGEGKNCASAKKNESASCLQLEHRMINEWKNFSGNDGMFSRCSADCSPGYRIDPLKDHAKCCWECKKCSGKTITRRKNMRDCHPCPSGQWATANQSSCEQIRPTFLGWTDTPAIIILGISSLGVIGVVCTFYVFYCFRNTPVVRASSRELCYVLLIGIGWCFLTPVFFIAEPTDAVCRAIPVVTGLCPALVVGTLLTKTNRISRIFNKKLIKTGTSSFLSKKWQLLMILCVCVLECIINIGSVYVNAAGSETIISDAKREVIKQCKELSDISVAIWWAYNIGLVITCTYQAFLTRKLPENYNEAKFISFTMLTTCIVVIIFIPTYIGTSGVYRTTITCFVFIIAGFASLACMFVPKVYIVLWRPEKNIPMQPRSSSVRLGTISPSASFVRRLSVDNGSSAEATEGRSRRIRSMPLITTPEEEGEGIDDARPVKKRSSSVSSGILREKPTASPSFGSSRHKRNRCVRVTIERIREEASNSEESDSESKQLQVDPALSGNAPAIENQCELESNCSSPVRENSEECSGWREESAPELEATEADRLLAFYQASDDHPTTCISDPTCHSAMAPQTPSVSALPGEDNVREETFNNVGESHGFCEQGANCHLDNDGSTIPYSTLSNSVPSKFNFANGITNLVGVRTKGTGASTGGASEKKRRNAVCQRGVRRLSDEEYSEKNKYYMNGFTPRQFMNRPSSQGALAHTQRTENSAKEMPKCHDASEDGPQSPRARAVTWIKALSKGGGHWNHTQSSPSLSDGVPLNDDRRGNGPEAKL